MTKSNSQTDIQELARRVAPDAPIEMQLEAMRGLLGLQDRHLAHAGGVSATTIRRWRVRGPSDTPNGIENLRTIVEEIAETGQKSPRAIGSWLCSRNRALGFERPIDLMRDADAETVRWIAEAGIAFACAYPLPEASPQGTAVPRDSRDLGGRLSKASEAVVVAANR